MDFCVISPTAGLERYAVLSKTHLVLAPVALKDRAYSRFYQIRRSADDFLILDNGAYEGHRIFHLDLLAWLHPQVVVLPDYFLQPWQRTWHAAIAQMDAYDDKYGPNRDFEWCYIPQAPKGDFHGFIESYQEAIDDPRISWIGIPRALSYAITDNPLARVEFARLAKRDRPGIKLHAFGMVNGDVHELPYLAAAGVNSIDSSAPVWRGWHACKSITDIADRGYWDDYGVPVNFSAERTFYYNNKPYDADSNLNVHAKNDDVILANLEACGVRIPTR
jgi:hypothetical protein